MKPRGKHFRVYQLDAYHYRIEIRKSPRSILCEHAVFYVSSKELHVSEDIKTEELEAMLKFAKDRFQKVQNVIKT